MPPNNVNSREGVSLREYFEKMVETCQKHHESRMQQAEKEVGTASRAMERRLDSMNEFRDTLKDQAARFVTVSQMDALQEKLELSIRPLQDFRVALDAKADQRTVLMTALMSLIGILIGMAGIVIALVK